MAVLRIVRWCRSHVIVSTLVGLVILCALYEYLSGIFVYSRDAYITTDIIALAPQVSGPLAVVAVKDNQDVRAGDILLKINPDPFRIELDREEANYQLAKANAQKANEVVAIASDRVASRQRSSTMQNCSSNARPSSSNLERSRRRSWTTRDRIAGMLCGVGILICVCFVCGLQGNKPARGGTKEETLL
ncbi:MAG TPA: biotin/lipoyl-binding protein [Chthoniobacterales bacterium]|nr:biotin/lipoyl-binding protein [Chthoniobacterales bacterium]